MDFVDNADHVPEDTKTQPPIQDVLPLGVTPAVKDPPTPFPTILTETTLSRFD